MDRAILQASDRSQKKVKVWGIFRDRLAEFFGANFTKKQSGKKRTNFVGIFWANFARN